MRRLFFTCKITLWLALLAGGFLNCSSPSPSSSGSTNLVGTGARDYLSAETYTSLVIEIQAVTGYAPSAVTQAAIADFLSAYLNKPGGITIHMDAPLTSPGKMAYSITDVEGIEQANRTLFDSGTQKTAYFLFLDGASTSDSSSGQILGQAYGSSSLVIYEKTIQNLSGGLGQPSRDVLEKTVTQHELGHILGLVDVGTAMQSAHQDSAHGAHCSNTACLMYWEVDTSNFIGNLLGGTVPPLDADCAADLHANGGF
jgi:hypothetical protein